MHKFPTSEATTDKTKETLESCRSGNIKKSRSSRVGSSTTMGRWGTMAEHTFCPQGTGRLKLKDNNEQEGDGINIAGYKTVGGIGEPQGLV